MVGGLILVVPVKLPPPPLHHVRQSLANPVFLDSHVLQTHLSGGVIETTEFCMDHQWTDREVFSASHVDGEMIASVTLFIQIIPHFAVLVSHVTIHEATIQSVSSYYGTTNY